MLGSSFAKDFLASEKAPYIVTLFVAALSWTAVRSADRLSGTPFLEYRVGHGSLSTGAGSTELRLRNITSAARFDCFVVTVATRAGQTLKFGDAARQEHRIQGTVLAQLTAKRSKQDEWVIQAENFAPGADVSLFIPASGEGSPLVLGQPCVGMIEAVEADDPKIDQKEKRAEKPKVSVPPVLIERGLETTFVEHELLILWSALALWLAAMLMLSRPQHQKLESSSSGLIDPQEAKHDAQGTLD